VRPFLVVPAILLVQGCATAPRPVSDADRSRFLFMAVLEGLWEDGADPSLLQPLLQKPREHFVPKCPLCTPVAHAFQVYAQSTDVPVFEARGDSFPRELAEGLRNAERGERLKALESLVARYVARRFERSNLSAETRHEMRLQLEAGKKDGMAQLGPDFGTSCPSCSGATRVR
jgi:hypothetical protein